MNRFTVEMASVFAIFFAFGADAPPSVNEAHYLCKAKHYWDNAWISRDMFLNSADAHLTFYLAFGWVTRWCDLATTAWIGRVAGWLLLAAGWTHVSRAASKSILGPGASAILFILFMDRFHLAGEWVVGGIEAKVFAYGFVLLAIGEAIRGRWKWVAPLVGIGSAFHIVAGGWAALAILVAWWLECRIALKASRDRGLKSGSIGSVFVAMIVFLACSALGWIPAVLLTLGTPSEIVAEGNVTYVYVRVSHHLVFHRFPQSHMIRFAILIGTWILIGFANRKKWQNPDVRLFRMVATGIVFAVVGVVVDQATQLAARFEVSSINIWATSAAILRYYWFRFADFALPLAMAWTCLRSIGLGANREEHDAKGTACQAISIALVLLGVFNLVARGESRLRPDSAIVRRLDKTPFRASTALKREEASKDWFDVCRWINEQTPADSLFLTPPSHQTFKWRTNRAEVVNWKDAPQDAKGLVEWRTRMDKARGVPPKTEGSEQIPTQSEILERVVESGKTYGADFLVLDTKRTRERPKLRKVYPQHRFQQSRYEVYSYGTKRILDEE